MEANSTTAFVQAFAVFICCVISEAREKFPSYARAISSVSLSISF